MFIFLIQEIVTAIIIMLFPSQGTCELHFYMLFPWFDHSPLNMDFLKHLWSHHKIQFLKEGSWFLRIFLGEDAEDFTSDNCLSLV